MRKMISERERAPLKNMGFDEATNTVEIGTNLEVDGKIVVNAGSDIVDVNGDPVTGGSEVSGTNDGTNWTSISIDGATYAIPAGGGTTHNGLYLDSAGLSAAGFYEYKFIPGDNIGIIKLEGEIPAELGWTTIATCNYTGIVRVIPMQQYATSEDPYFRVSEGNIQIGSEYGGDYSDTLIIIGNCRV